jgi:hypothetical protein
MSDVTVEQLSDGRLQVFVIDSDHNVLSRWKTSTSGSRPSCLS